jgi:hypothetical protein
MQAALDGGLVGIGIPAADKTSLDQLGEAMLLLLSIRARQHARFARRLIPATRHLVKAD